MARVRLATLPSCPALCRVSTNSSKGGGQVMDTRHKAGHDLLGQLWPLSRDHIRNTPNLVSGTGAFNAALSASDSTRRVSDGRMMPSSQSRAVA